MRKVILVQLVLVISMISVFGQWTTGENDHIYRYGTVSIGSSNPQGSFHIVGPTVAPADILCLTNKNTAQRLIFHGNPPSYASGNTTVFRILYEAGLNNRDNGFIDFHSSGFLSFGSSGLERMRISSNGNIGIGTTSPNALLHLHSDLSTSLKMTYSQGGKFAIRGNDDEWVFGVMGDSGVQDIQIGTTAVGQRTISFAAGGRYRMKVLANGNVGIGTTSPEHKLDIVGTIRAHEILVNTQKTADFVFEENYPLKPLKEVKQFITENKHLPDIAPADSMVQNGVNMGEFQIQLLQKIEELTLYVIKQEQRIDELTHELDALKKDQ